MVEFSSPSPNTNNNGLASIEFSDVSTTRTPSPPTAITSVPEDINVTVSPRDSWLAYDLESLEGYSRMRSPGAGLDDTRRNIVLDDDGFISGKRHLVHCFFSNYDTLPHTSQTTISRPSHSLVILLPHLYMSLFR